MSLTLKVWYGRNSSTKKLDLHSIEDEMVEVCVYGKTPTPTHSHTNIPTHSHTNIPRAMQMHTHSLVSHPQRVPPYSKLTSHLDGGPGA